MVVVVLTFGQLEIIATGIGKLLDLSKRSCLVSLVEDEHPAPSVGGHVAVDRYLYLFAFFCSIHFDELHIVLYLSHTVHLDVLTRARWLPGVAQHRQFAWGRQRGGLRHGVLDLAVVPAHFDLIKRDQLVDDVGAWLRLQP